MDTVYHTTPVTVCPGWWFCSHCPLNFSGQPIEEASVVCILSELISHTDKITYGESIKEVYT